MNKLPQEHELERHRDSQAEECERDACRVEASTEHDDGETDHQSGTHDDVPPRLDESCRHTIRQFRAI